MSSSAVYTQADETPHLSFLLLLSEGSVLRPLSRAVWVVLSTAVLTAVTPVPRQDMALCEMPSLLPILHFPVPGLFLKIYLKREKNQQYTVF